VVVLFFFFLILFHKLKKNIKMLESLRLELKSKKKQKKIVRKKKLKIYKNGFSRFERIE